jgi:hypothetical protein
MKQKPNATQAQHAERIDKLERKFGMVATELTRIEALERRLCVLYAALGVVCVLCACTYVKSRKVAQ